MPVRGARQPDGGPASVCGTTADFEECSSLFFTVPRPQRLLLVGSGEWTGLNTTTGGNFGQCGFAAGNVADLGLRLFGESGTGPSAPSNFAVNSVTGVLDQGGYEIVLACRDTSLPSGGVAVRRAELSVVALGDG